MVAKARRQPIKIKDRIKSFSEANLPRIIEIEFQAFTDATDGTEIPAHAMSVGSTCSKRSCVMMEVTAPNLEWLARAVHSLEVKTKKSQKRKLEDLSPSIQVERPTLTQPHVRWKARDASKWTLTIKIKDAETGKDRYVTKSVKPTSNPDVNATLVKEAEDQMESLYVASVTASCKASTEGGSENDDDDDDDDDEYHSIHVEVSDAIDKGTTIAS